MAMQAGVQGERAPDQAPGSPRSPAQRAQRAPAAPQPRGGNPGRVPAPERGSPLQRGPAPQAPLPGTAPRLRDSVIPNPYPGSPCASSALLAASMLTPPGAQSLTEWPGAGAFEHMGGAQGRHAGGSGARLGLGSPCGSLLGGAPREGDPGIGFFGGTLADLQGLSGGSGAGLAQGLVQGLGLGAFPGDALDSTFSFPSFQ